MQKGERIVLAMLERSGIVFLTAVASGNGGGCIGCCGLCNVMMSCNYICEVVVVMRIFMNAQFL